MLKNAGVRVAFTAMNEFTGKGEEEDISSCKLLLSLASAVISFVRE